MVIILIAEPHRQTFGITFKPPLQSLISLNSVEKERNHIIGT